MAYKRNRSASTPPLEEISAVETPAVETPAVETPAVEYTSTSPFEQELENVDNAVTSGVEEEPHTVQSANKRRQPQRLPIKLQSLKDRYIRPLRNLPKFPTR